MSVGWCSVVCKRGIGDVWRIDRPVRNSHLLGIEGLAGLVRGCCRIVDRAFDLGMNVAMGEVKRVSSIVRAVGVGLDGRREDRVFDGTGDQNVLDCRSRFRIDRGRGRLVLEDVRQVLLITCQDIGVGHITTNRDTIDLAARRHRGANGSAVDLERVDGIGVDGDRIHPGAKLDIS